MKGLFRNKEVMRSFIIFTAASLVFITAALEIGRASCRERV